MLKGTGKAYRQSRELRRTMTLPEVVLWEKLRGRRLGHKWRKQHPAGPYSLDFYCDAAKLCIEIDGEAHACDGRPQADARRDAWLAERGVFTLRIPAGEILNNLEGVVVAIAGHALERAPLHHPAAPDGPPPRAKLGED
jgi:very-short-patch-repair endonuclease